MNVLLDIYESGVPLTIKSKGTISDTQYVQYVQKIERDYGLQESCIIDGLNAWIDVCLGKGVSQSMHFTPTSVHYPSVTGHTHKPITTPSVIKGNVSDYEVKDLGNGKAELTKFVGFEQEDMLVPNVIDGKQIVCIGANAFDSCKGIKRLVIAPGIKTIGVHAFQNCDNLQEAIIGEGTKVLEIGAFCKCPLLKKVSLPTTLTTIKQGRHKEYSWESVTGVFSESGLESIDLPNGITTIPVDAFMNCWHLKTVMLPDNLTEISAHAFEGCAELESIILPPSMKVVGEGAFCNCKITNVVLNEGLRELGNFAFSGCKFTNIRIPSTVEEFGWRVFGRSSGTVTAACYAGSKAVEYARKEGLTVVRA
ncbi:leucine-rich repeat domain-containing protein [Pseudoflavonifractor sp. MSJ-30]|nr:leucine-rich repeat domain-containing protein [Pseudoflavonifractor sp. MSJ-30]